MVSNNRYIFVGIVVLSTVCLCFHGQARCAEPVQYRLRQIMLEPQVSPEHEAAIRKRAQDCLTDARKGGDFNALAKKYSEEPGVSKTGGDLGFFTRSQMVKAFSDAVFSMKPGQIGGPVKTQYGYHIIKLHEIDGERRHASHILFALNPDASDSARVMKKLSEARVRLVAGEPFDVVFNQYNSNDLLKTTRGYIVWQTPDELLPSFEEHLIGLKRGDITKPFVSIIGFHLVVVDSINYDNSRLLKGFPPGINGLVTP
jgi:peptidyl-prolyl cis-trans isomerase SurA